MFFPFIIRGKTESYLFFCLDGFLIFIKPYVILNLAHPSAIWW